MTGDLSVTIYVDSDYKCHLSDDGSLRGFDSAFFDGRCDAFIEGYRYLPEGETWLRADGVEFCGEMISPWKPYAGLHTAQLEYELALAKAELADMGAALETLGVTEDE